MLEMEKTQDQIIAELTE